jgi:hypothetical protein
MSDDDKITDLGEVRGQKFLAELEAGKYPAMSAGYGPIEKFVDWYLANGYCYSDALHAFAYSAAAECFRGLPADRAEEMVMDTFVSIVSELLRYGPHFGDEAYGGPPKPGEMEAVCAKLHAAVDRHQTMFQNLEAFRSETQEKG